MHLEPEITRCRILIGICAASFGLGDHPSYASEPVSIQHFNCWEAFGNKTSKCHRHKVNPAQLAHADQSLVSLWPRVSLIMIGICF